MRTPARQERPRSKAQGRARQLKASKLFRGGTDVRFDALVQFPFRDQIYASGYRKAADTLVARARRSRTDLNFLVYPIVFLYRHYLELRLKLLQSDLCELRGLSPTHHEHDLAKLWTDVRQHLAHVFPTEAATLDPVQKVVLEFHQLDRGSTAFRYSRSNDGDALSGLTRINVLELSRALKKPFDRLEGASDAVGEMLSSRA